MRLAWLVSLSILTAPACGGELLSGVSITSGASSGKNADGTEMSEDDRAAWIAIAILLGVTSVGFTVAGVVQGEISWLDEHRQDLRLALARGAGPVVTDLAAGLRLPGRLVPHLGGTLRANRAALLPIVEEAGPADPERVRRFGRALELALRADPVLAPYTREAFARAVMAGHLDEAGRLRHEHELRRALAARRPSGARAP